MSIWKNASKFDRIVFMVNKAILIAGGAGFIGSYLCGTLLKEKNKVICLDNLTTGSEINIRNFFSDQNFTFINEDICSANFVQVLKTHHIDEIYHLASPASVIHITAHPIQAALANSMGTKNLLDLASANNAKILFASSSEAYGDPKEHPQKESYWGNVNSVGVRSGYDEGKRFGEALCMAYYREGGVKVKIVRIFNTYGPNSRVDDSRVIPSFVAHALQNRSLPVHGDGSQTRSFCYVSDMVEGIIKMMESNQTGPINLGNPKEYHIIDIAKKILSATSSSSKINFVKRPKDDPERRKPDIVLARQRLGWSPKVSFDEGLEKTINYFKDIIGKST